MPRLDDEPVERFHVMLYKSDLEILRMRYGQTPGIAPAVRIIVRQFLRRLEQRIQENENADPPHEQAPGDCWSSPAE